MVALGNPGAEYAATRHNAGFILGDALATRWRFPPFRRAGNARVTEGRVAAQQVWLVKPQTYMNLSGAALGPLVSRADFDSSRDLLILVDDIALPLGTFRIRARGSAGGHNGLESVENALGSRDYARLRIGIGPLPDDVEDWAEFVLDPFSRDEAATLTDVLPTLAEAVECWIADGTETAMNRFNRRGS